MSDTGRVHLVPFFGQRPLEKITREDVEASCRAWSGRAESQIDTELLQPAEFRCSSSVSDAGWVVSNPCKGVGATWVSTLDPQTRYLDRGA